MKSNKLHIETGRVKYQNIKIIKMSYCRALLSLKNNFGVSQPGFYYVFESEKELKESEIEKRINQQLTVTNPEQLKKNQVEKIFEVEEIDQEVFEKHR